MIWQDIVFSIGNIVAIMCELITVRAKAHEKPKRRVAFIVGAMLLSFCFCYASYQLWYSLSVCSVNVALHIIIGFQKRTGEI